MHVQLSLSIHFYLLHLLLNSCDQNDAFWHQFMLERQPNPSAGNTGSYFSRSVSTKQSGWPGNPVDYWIWWLMQECVYIIQDTWMRHQRLDAWPSISQNVEAVGQWRKRLCACKKAKRTSLGTSAKLKPSLFRTDTLYNRLFSEPPTVYYLKANKISKSQGIKKFNMRIIF